MSDDDPILSQLYHDDAGEVPAPELDRRVLQAAEAANRGRRPRRGFARRLAGPLSGLATAAVVVMSVALLRDATPPPAAPAASAPAKAPAGEPVPLAAAPGIRREAAAPTRGLASTDASADSAALRAAAKNVEAAADHLERAARVNIAAAEERAAASRTQPATVGAAEAPPAKSQTTRLTASGCSEPYFLPAGASVHLDDVPAASSQRGPGVAVQLDGQTFTIRCEAGTWLQQPLDAADLAPPRSQDQ